MMIGLGRGDPEARGDEGEEEVLPLAPEAGEGPGGALAQAACHEFVKTGDPERLDVFLADNLPGRSRAFIQKLIAEGHVTITPCEREVKPAIRVVGGNRVRVVIPPPRKLDLSPLDIPFTILHEDRHLAVIDKPAMLAVHPAPDQATHTLVNALLFRLRELSSIGGVERPGIVHRLDKETSGVLVVAKNDAAHHSLARQFKDRTIRKVYLAIARGEPESWEGRIDRSIGKSYTHAKKQMVRLDGSGREAVTDYRVLEKYRGYALIELYPHTGRTHQIRVHLASLRLPIAGDKLYGREKRVYLSDLRDQEREPEELPIIERHALHAASIAFRHPATGEELAFSAPLHPDMHALLKALEQHRHAGKR
jgi:23S rRNA pseudouridine1911/1915/1917 synthase